MKILLIAALLFPTIAMAQSAVVPIVVRVHNAGVFQHADIIGLITPLIISFIILISIPPQRQYLFSCKSYRNL